MHGFEGYAHKHTYTQEKSNRQCLKSKDNERFESEDQDCLYICICLILIHCCTGFVLKKDRAVGRDL